MLNLGAKFLPDVQRPCLPKQFLNNLKNSFLMSKQPITTKPVAQKPAAAKTAAKQKKVPAATSVKKKASTKKESPIRKSPEKKPPTKKVASGQASLRKPRKTSAKSAKKASVDVVPTNVAEAVAAVAAVETKKGNAQDSPVSPPPAAAVGFSLDDVRSILDSKKDTENEKDDSVNEQAIHRATVVAAPKHVQSFAKNKTQSASVADILGFNPKKSTTRPDRDASTVPTGWKPFYISLIKLRDQLKVGLGARSADTIGASSRESSGELSVNSSDAGSESFDRDVAITMVAGEQEMLNEVESAIDRVFDGTYGVCEQTAKPIRQTRLKAVPYTRYSLEGQAEYEQHARAHKDTGGGGEGAFATLSEASLGDDDA
jgi:RNA polymerase-binding transcription factor DksA